MPRHCHSCCNGLGFATGQRQAGGGAGPLSVVADRLTQQLANEPNALAACLAQRIEIAHASPDGSLAAQVGHL